MERWTIRFTDDPEGVTPLGRRSRHLPASIIVHANKGLFNDEQKFEIFERRMDGTPFSKAEEVQPD